MFLVKRIIIILCAKNYKSKFTFIEVIQKSVGSLSGLGVESFADKIRHNVLMERKLVENV